MNASKEQRAEAIAQIRKYVSEGSTIYTVLRHVSASGMSRRIDLYTIRDNRPVFLTGYVGAILGMSRRRDKDGLTVSGCGMDMGFHVVYNLSAALFGHDDRGGYKLNHEWL